LEMMDDVIELEDSDDELAIIEDESTSSSKNNVGASISIVNSVPLDLNSILGGAPLVARKTPASAAGQTTSSAGRFQSSRPTPYQRPLTATVRLAHNGAGGGQPIRSSTAVTHTTSYQPLPRQQQFAAHHHYPTPGRPLNGVQNGHAAMNRNGGRQDEVMKMRLQMAHNGSYQRVPPRDLVSVRTSAPVMAVEVSAERLKNYAFDAERVGAERTDNSKKGSPDGVMSGQRFRCTYDKCNALIFGNVNFMNHVWSHVAVWKPTDEEIVEKGRTDVDALSSCPQCLARFEYPYQMQIHYTRAHSRLKQAVSGNTCMICEKEVTSLKHHLAMHHPRDAPYRCPVCTYKCNLRMHLYDHFCRRHSHHTTLMCPFCSYFKVVEVPQTKNKSRLHVIKCREFTSHMRRHEIVSDKFKDINRLNPEVSDMVVFNPQEAATNKRRTACDKCAQCFTKPEDRLVHIKEMHKPLNSNYTCRNRLMDTKERRPSELMFIAKGEHAMCAECKKKRPEERNKKCAACARRVFSIDGIAHKNVAFSDNVVRGVYGLATASVVRGRCVCGFGSTSGNLLAAHFIACRRLLKVMLKKGKEGGGGGEEKREKRDPTKEEEKQETEELALFAIKAECEPADLETMRSKLESLQSEIEQAVVERIRSRDAPPAPVQSKKTANNKWIPIKDPDAIDQLQERINSIKFEPEAMTFRARISRNDMSQSEKQFKELMAKREEED
ncbi:hypothetical protein PENTCL1PPCAC_20769, partial [Pristionchus entomophagus]